MCAAAAAAGSGVCGTTQAANTVSARWAAVAAPDDDALVRRGGQAVPGWGCEVPRVTVHELRHTAASLMIASGANVNTVQSQLGHKAATMTLDQYGHLVPDELDDVADTMDDLVSGCAQNVPEGPGLSE